MFLRLKQKTGFLFLVLLLQILQKLKGLALDTETELERQEEALDGITSAVDHAILTIDKDNRRMRKLT